MLLATMPWLCGWLALTLLCDLLVTLLIPLQLFLLSTLLVQVFLRRVTFSQLALLLWRCWPVWENMRRIPIDFWQKIGHAYNGRDTKNRPDTTVFYERILFCSERELVMRLLAVLTCMLILFAVGLRLMFYGFQGIVSNPSVLGLLGLIAGIICLLAGIVSGVLLLKPSYRT